MSFVYECQGPTESCRHWDYTVYFSWPGGKILISDPGINVSVVYFSTVNRNNKPVHEISNNVVCATSKASDQPAHTRSLIRAFASRLSIL